MKNNTDTLTSIVATLSKLSANLENIKSNQQSAFDSIQRDIEGLQRFQHDTEVKEGIVKGAAWGIKVAAIIVQAIISAAVFVTIKYIGL